jgi:hypothetical protein
MGRSAPRWIGHSGRYWRPHDNCQPSSRSLGQPPGWQGRPGRHRDRRSRHGNTRPHDGIGCGREHVGSGGPWSESRRSCGQGGPGADDVEIGSHGSGTGRNPPRLSGPLNRSGTRDRVAHTSNGHRLTVAVVRFLLELPDRGDPLYTGHAESGIISFQGGLQGKHSVPRSDNGDLTWGAVSHGSPGPVPRQVHGAFR